MKLKEKVALITGAGRGIGKAVALAYGREGARLAICARTAAEIEQTAKEATAGGAECLGLVADVSAEESVGGLVIAVEKRFGRIDVLVNNAGVMTRPAPIAQYELRKWDYTIAVNLRGTFLLTRAVLPLMIRQRAGSIINVSSSIGRGAYADFSAYAASKWAVEGFTQTLAVEASGHNIRANTVDPGYIATKITGYRGSKPESAVEVFLFLAADESRGVSGKMLNASGWRSQVQGR